MDQFQNAFREEAQELLAELESALLELEKDPQAVELIGRVFRAMHTLKGSSAMFGFEEINNFTHNIENVYDLVRDGKVPVTHLLIDMTLRAGDLVRQMLEPGEDGSGAPNPEDVLALRESFQHYLTAALASPPTPSPASPPPPEPPAEPESGRTTTFRVVFQPEADIFNSGTNPVLLLDELRDLGPCEIIAWKDRIPSLEEIDPEACYTEWEIFLTTEHDSNAVRDVFIFVEDRCVLDIQTVQTQGPGEGAPVDKKLGEILVERGELSAGDIRQALENHKKIGEILVETGRLPRETVTSALAEQKHVREVHQRKQQAEAAASIRVPAEKLDRLVNMVGELVTVQSRLSQLSTRINDPALTQVAEEVERLIAELRDNTMGIRMLPIGTTFNRFQRLVRDLAAELNKEVFLETEGADTELDKGVIEKLNDPLVHIIRNCIDHGIEMPDDREATGKPRQGTILLSAQHSGANVLITIRDDGKGLDGKAIQAKAIQKGLIAPDTVLSEKEMFGLILLPGFSTKETISALSGRGVGMDVVKRTIEAQQGSIDIQSEKGRGTTIILKLPLTLAIIDGLLVRIDGHFFVMPLAIIEECVELSRDDVGRAHGKQIAEIRGEIVPYLRLRDAFSIGGTPPPIEQIVTTDLNGGRVGFVVDQVVGGHQTVIKNLGRLCKDVQTVSGATILGDGTVALILDLPKLVEIAELTERNRQRNMGN